MLHGSGKATPSSAGHPWVDLAQPKEFTERGFGNVFSSAAPENKGKGLEKHHHYLCEILPPAEPSSAELALQGVAGKVPFLILKLVGEEKSQWNEISFGEDTSMRFRILVLFCRF